MKPPVSLINKFLIIAILGVSVGTWVDHHLLSERRQSNIDTLNEIIRRDTLLLNQTIATLNTRRNDDIKSSDGNVEHMGFAVDRDIMAMGHMLDDIHKEIDTLQNTEVK